MESWPSLRGWCLEKLSGRVHVRRIMLKVDLGLNILSGRVRLSKFSIHSVLYLDTLKTSTVHCKITSNHLFLYSVQFSMYLIHAHYVHSLKIKSAHRPIPKQSFCDGEAPRTKTELRRLQGQGSIARLPLSCSATPSAPWTRHPQISPGFSPKEINSPHFVFQLFQRTAVRDFPSFYTDFAHRTTLEIDVIKPNVQIYSIMITAYTEELVPNVSRTSVMSTLVEKQTSRCHTYGADPTGLIKAHYPPAPTVPHSQI